MVQRKCGENMYLPQTHILLLKEFPMKNQNDAFSYIHLISTLDTFINWFPIPLRVKVKIPTGTQSFIQITLPPHAHSVSQLSWSISAHSHFRALPLFLLPGALQGILLASPLISFRTFHKCHLLYQAAWPPHLNSQTPP